MDQLLSFRSGEKHAIIERMQEAASLIHFFFSPSSACMIAICPVGPPKLLNPSFSQNRKASPKLRCCVPSGQG